MTSAPVRETYSVRGLQLAYHRWGPEDGTPVLALHGFMDHGLAYTFVAEALPEGYCLVAPDMRGHGDSGWVGAGGYYHFYDYFDDMRVLVDRLGWERFGVVAHSMGGSVAAGLVATMPERVHALVMLEGMGPPFADLEGLPDRLARWSFTLRRESCVGDVASRRASRSVMADHAEAAQKLMRANSRLSPERAARLAQSFTEPSSDGAGVVWRQDPLHRTPAAKPYQRAEAESLWRRIACPVLSVQGAVSAWRPSDLAARHAVLSDVTVVEVPGAGHNLHHDRPDLVAASMHAWMRAEPAALPSELVRTDP